MTGTEGARGVYPGTFNPPTVAHLAIVEAVLETHALQELDLVVSRRPILKEDVEIPTIEDRLAVLRASVAHLEAVHVRVTDHRLIADIADGYDLVVMGADKWRQIHDLDFYDDPDHRDRSLRRLPRIAVVSRGDDAAAVTGAAVGPVAAIPLVVATDHAWVSSTAARHGAVEFMTDAARAFDRRTGAWTDPGRYRAP